MGVNNSGDGVKVRAALRKAWLAGFLASGEGWNGEYPFERKPDADLLKRATDYAAKASTPIRGEG